MRVAFKAKYHVASGVTRDKGLGSKGFPLTPNCV
jgi:hypothetical protein